MVKKKEWPKELVYIDLNRGNFQFYNIELNRLGFDHFQVVFHFGRYGNKGTNKVLRFSGKESYLQAKKAAYKKFYEIKSEGYIRRDKMEEVILKAVKQEQKVDNDKKYKKNQGFSSKHNLTKKCVCNFCKQPIHYNLFEKINSWGRGEGNWDFNIKSPLYQKVICLDCQIDKGIFQKKIDLDFKL